MEPRNSVSQTSRAIDAFVNESYYSLNLKMVVIEQASPASAVACLGREGTVMVGARGVRTQAIQ